MKIKDNDVNMQDIFVGHNLIYLNLRDERFLRKAFYHIDLQEIWLAA